MIPRYTPAEFAELWSDQIRFDTWFEVEMSACAAMEKHGVIPEGTAETILDAAIGFRPDPARIAVLEAETHHDVVAFLRHLEESLGESARWLHFGLTSSDVVDTAFAVLLGRATGMIDRALETLLCTLALKAKEHAHTAMVGRTHGQHAEPTTFGLVLAGHYQELNRAQRRMLQARFDILTGTISGAVGTYAQLSPEIEREILCDFKLRPEPVPTQVVARDRHAALFWSFGMVATGLERLALTVRHLARTEVAEVRERFSAGQTGSSAMPHKRNPIVSEQLCGLARYVRSAISPAMEDVALWHERDISHSSVERIIAPDVTAALAHMLERAQVLIANLEVDAGRMMQNLQSTGGLVFSEPLMLALVRSGMPKKQAYQLVQRRAHEPVPFRDAVASDPEIRKALGPEQLERCFSLDHSLRHVDAILAGALPEIVE